MIASLEIIGYIRSGNQIIICIIKVKLGLYFVIQIISDKISTHRGHVRQWSLYLMKLYMKLNIS